MIVESSMRELIANTERIPTTKRHHIANQVVIVRGFEAQRLGEDDVLFSAVTSEGHNPKIRVKVTEDEHSPTTVNLGDTQVHITPVSVASDDVQVSCDCDDFFFRFARINSKYGVLFGRIDRVYIPKGTRHVGPVSTVPAVCKHIIKFTHLLRSHNIMK